MDIPDLFARAKAPIFSLEFFLPKNPADIGTFLETVKGLKSLDPAFVTLTYGAGGSERNATVETAGRIQQELGIETCCHLTCISHTRAEIDSLLGQIRRKGIKHIVALRGDAPKDGSAKPVGQRDFGYARDLIEHIKKTGGFRQAVAGYPEAHPEAPSADFDLKNLKAKVDAGGDWVVTQLFFDNQDYFEFVKKSRALGVKVPIVPGIMPVTGYAQLKRFTQLCGSKIPAELAARLEKVQTDPEAVIACGIEWATAQCRELLERGAPGIHFYTLNRSRSTTEILRRLRGAA
jgi:methylenetetrahydrofolate reductase (NADPH)